MKDKLTKAEIISNIYDRHSIEKRDIHKTIDLFFDELKKGLANDKVIELRSLGTFKVRVRKGRDKTRNPKTGEIIQASSKGVATFKPGKELQKMVKEIV